MINIKEALLASAKFFEENPTRRITGDFAEDDHQNTVDPRGEEATCWCALGRIIKEADLPLDPGSPGEYRNPALDYYQNLWQALRPLGVGPQDVYHLNDDPDVTTDEVVEYLRRLTDA